MGDPAVSTSTNPGRRDRVTNSWPVGEISFFECARVSQEKYTGARDFFDLMRSINVDFLCAAKMHPEPNPQGIMNKDGNLLIPMGMANESLEPEIQRANFPGKGTATYSFLQRTRSFTIAQNLSLLEDKSQSNIYASRQLAFAQQLYDVFRPRYGWIDELGENAPGGRTISERKLKYIFWANFFGPDYVGKYGSSFLKNAPGWKKGDLTDGGFLFVVTKQYWDWVQAKPPSVLEYFKNSVPEIEFFRARQGG